MTSAGRHAADPVWRLSLTAGVAATIAVTGIFTAIMAAKSASTPGPPDVAVKSAAGQLPAVAPSAVAASIAIARQNSAAQHGAGPSGKGAVSLALTAADRKSCPAGAAACVDLARRITWLQGSGQVTFGPVQLEPGKPGSKHQTPRGTFRVSWKAGPGYVSTEYNEAMPWATFFAPGGIAFHGGSLTEWSHGCVHLTVANAHYYNEHLPVGAEVVVF